MYSLIQFDNICNVYEFEPNGALVSYGKWRQMCQLGFIKPRIALAHHLEHLIDKTMVPDDYCMILAWVASIDFRWGTSQAFNDVICGQLRTLLYSGIDFAAIDAINLTLSVMAATNASMEMQFNVRRMISEWLFKDMNVVSLVNSLNVTHFDCWKWRLCIQYYGPYDSPILANQQMARFNVIDEPADLSDCAWPLNVGAKQIDEYLQLKGIYDNEDVKLFVHSLFSGTCFTAYSSYYRLQFKDSTNGDEPIYGDRLAIFHYGCRGVYFEADDYFYMGDENNAINYLQMLLMCGKRGPEFLESSQEEFDKAFIRWRWQLQCWGLYLIPKTHKETGVMQHNDRMDWTILYSEVVGSPLFVKYIKIYWQHRDMVARVDLKDNVINNRGRLGEPGMHFNGHFAQTLPHYFDKQFAIDAINEAKAINNEITSLMGKIFTSL